MLPIAFKTARGLARMLAVLRRGQHRAAADAAARDDALLVGRNEYSLCALCVVLARLP